MCDNDSNFESWLAMLWCAVFALVLIVSVYKGWTLVELVEHVGCVIEGSGSSGVYGVPADETYDPFLGE